MNLFKKKIKSDTPKTVEPLTQEEIYRRKLQSYFTAQKNYKELDLSDGAYIWKKADEYVKQYLTERGYEILESSVFDECVGYRCIRKNIVYTIFMFAYTGEKPEFVTAAFCEKLANKSFAEDSIALFLCLTVDKYTEENEIKYRVLTYNGNENFAPELWALETINGKIEFLYYPTKEMMDGIWEFMYAFNRDATEVYDCIITENNPSIEGEPGCDGIFLNSSFYLSLRRMHHRYGDMKVGYIRFNDIVFSEVTYIDNVGYFTWSAYNETNRMFNFKVCSFEEDNIAEFVKAELREPENLFSYIPRLIKAAPLPAVQTERFAVLLFFDNGECRKYVLPIDDKYAADEAVSYDSHVFSDGIWASAKVVPNVKNRESGYPDVGTALTFKNNFYISQMQCYLASQPYSEPKLKNQTVYSDDRYKITKIWEWDVESIYEDSETGLLKVLLEGFAFNYEGKSTYANTEGRRLSSISFDYIDNFSEDAAIVSINGKGYGVVDKDLNFIIPVKYSDANNFNNGKAKVYRDNRWYFVDKTGEETLVGNYAYCDTYQDVADFSEGLCRVSTLKLGFMDLAYHSDHESIAGTWGYINENGDQIISPQYIYAYDFENGIAIAAKGKWTIDSKWDNKYNQGRYWTEYELWGGIDKNGNEIIPFIFDEIEHFGDRTDIYIAHYGGWDNGKWGVIDRTGEWLAQPVFEKIDYCSSGNLIVFYNEDYWDSDDALCGIYDLESKQVLLEPQFKDINFIDNGDLCVEVYDNELGRDIQKIIDLKGNERFKSIYTYISAWRGAPYEVFISDENGRRSGLIDAKGNEIIPCTQTLPIGHFLYPDEEYIFEEDGKHGLKDTEGKVILPAIYSKLNKTNLPFLIAECDNNENICQGLIERNGEIILPFIYEDIRIHSDKKHIFAKTDNGWEMLLIEYN